MSLSSLIVERSVASMRQVEEALARQVIYGGDLATNLLEVCLVDEVALTQAAADAMGLPAAPAGSLPEAPVGTRALVPVDVAAEHVVVPIALQEDRMVLAVAEPLPRELHDHLAFALGMAVEQQGALVMRVRDAIARAYGATLERRMQRLVARLAGTPARPGSTPPPLSVAPQVPEAPAPPSARPSVASVRPPSPSELPTVVGEYRPSVPAGRPPIASDAPTVITEIRPSTSALFAATAHDPLHADTAPAPAPAEGIATPLMPPHDAVIVDPYALPVTTPMMPPAGAYSVSPSLAATAIVQVPSEAPPVAPPRPPNGDAPTPRAADEPTEFAGVEAGHVEREASLLKFNVPAADRARAGRRRRGPLTWDAARKEAEDAADRDALLDLFFDFARQFFDYAALFLVHGDIAEGRDAFGLGAPRERVIGIGVPLDLPSMLSRARDSRMPLIAQAPADGLDAVLLTDLQRADNAETAVVPLVVRTRAVAVLLADCDDAGVDPIGVEQVAAFAGVVGKAFERIIVKRKLDGGSPSPPRERPPVPLTLPLPPVPLVRQRAALRRPSRAPSRTPSRGPAPVDGRSSLNALLASNAHRASNALHASNAFRAATEVTDTTPPPPVNIAAVRPIAARPLPREEPESPPPMPVGARELAVVAVVAARVEEPGPQIEVDVTSFERDTQEALALFEELGWDPNDDGPSSMAPISAISVPPHRPPSARATSDGELPSVIVDVEGELAAIVDRIVAGDADDQAEGELLRQGTRAMRVIMDRFPGPVTVERSQMVGMSTPPRPSDCGPLLRLIARERRVALPFVLERLAHPDAETRGWATYLLAELPYVEGIPYLLPRLRDPDAATRSAAARALGAVARTSPAQVRAAVLGLARSADAKERSAAMHAMGIIHDPVVVPDLVRALADGDERVVTDAHDALVQVTRHDFGQDARPWLRWWEQHGSAPRVEWLIDALTHDVSEIRRSASDELRAVSKETFGYASDMPARERERVQQRYRDWWLTEGRARLRDS